MKSTSFSSQLDSIQRSIIRPTIGSLVSPADESARPPLSRSGEVAAGAVVHRANVAATVAGLLAMVAVLVDRKTAPRPAVAMEMATKAVIETATVAVRTVETVRTKTSIASNLIHKDLENGPQKADVLTTTAIARTATAVVRPILVRMETDLTTILIETETSVPAKVTTTTGTVQTPGIALPGRMGIAVATHREPKAGATPTDPGQAAPVTVHRMGIETVAEILRKKVAIAGVAEETPLAAAISN